ncbi:MAG: hypothetical protein AB1566_13730 [Chloroflexota bacterium]
MRRVQGAGRQGKGGRVRQQKRRASLPVKKPAPSGVAKPETPVAGETSGRRVLAAAPRAQTALTLSSEDYRYVYSDLKRIGILAAAMFGALIVLSFLIK